jgi:hypothetical protein
MARKIKQFTRRNLRELRAEVDEALERIGRGHGVAIQVGSGSFTGAAARFKVELRITENPAERIEAAEFRRHAALLGLRPDDLGREFTIQGTAYRIIGAKLSRRKYPIIAENARGTKYAFSAQEVRRALSPRIS